MLEKTITVVVADDDDLDSRLTERAVRETLPGAQVILIHDGLKCLETLQKIQAGTDPAIVFMDFRMPKMSCMEILAQLDRQNLMDRTKIVLFSSGVSPTDVQRAIGAGVSDYIQKPTDPTDYAELVREACLQFQPKWHRGAEVH